MAEASCSFLANHGLAVAGEEALLRGTEAHEAEGLEVTGDDVAGLEVDTRFHRFTDDHKRPEQVDIAYATGRGTLGVSLEERSQSDQNDWAYFFSIAPCSA